MPEQEASFADFDLDPRCLRVLDKNDIQVPTPIQAAVLPVALEGRDVIAIAQTGTGKTLAYVLPLLVRIAQGKAGRNQLLVLTPTRELAVQVHHVIEEYGKALRIRSVCVYGGVNLEQQARALRRGCPVIVATPGRLLDHMERGNVRFNELEALVFDEADRMLDMGFLPDIRRILRTVPAERQTLLCSATFPREIERLAQDILHEPERITVGAISQPVDNVRQILYTVAAESKIALLLQLLRDDVAVVDSCIVFMRTKSRTERVAKALHRAGIDVQAIHGDRTQRQRQRALEGFRDGRFPVLVATDVAARGLDIDNVSHVINYDIPVNPDDYIHRIGRTARASAKGDAITFVSPGEHIALEGIERALGNHLPRAEWEGAVPVLSLFHAPEEQAARRRTARRRRTLLRRR